MTQAAFLMHITKYQKFIGCLVLIVFWSCQHNAQQRFDEQLLMGKVTPTLEGKSIQLHPRTFEAYQKMRIAAQEDGIDLVAVSGYRSFERQKKIWNRKYKRFTETQGLSPKEAIKKIIAYSTIPGTSRHHWGTDLDIIDKNIMVTGDVLRPENYNDDGPYSALKKWMDKHANSFGFYLVYTDNPSRKGFYYEPWHYTYVLDSKPMLEQYMKLDILSILSDENILGFEYFDKSFLDKYTKENILDINPLVK